MIIKSWSVVIAAALLLSGCSFSKKSPEEVKANAFDEVSKKMKDSTLDTRDAAMSLSDFEVYFEDGAQPNQYSLVVKAARKVPKMILAVEGLTSVEMRGTDTVKMPIPWKSQNAVVSLQVLTRENIPATNLSFGTYPVPRDFVFEGETHAVKEINPNWETSIKGEFRLYRRIYFQKGAVLVTNGFNVTLQAEEILFLGQNVIRLTDSAPYKLTIQDHLSDGSDIKIIAKSVIGNATIRMVNFDGFPGNSTRDLAYKMDPSIFQPAKNGVKGQDAWTGHTETLSMGTDPSGSPIGGGKTHCERPPTNGTDGHDGVIIHAEDGTAGGDTGNLTLDIADYSQANFRIFLIPGEGGIGGLANFEGQKGGIGGAAGRNAAECRIKSVAGKNGRDSTAADSRPGRDGAPGRLGQLIVPHDSKHFDIIYELK